MAVLDAPFRKLVRALLKTLGADATITRTPELMDGSYDPTEGTGNPPAPVTYAVKISPPEPFNIRDVDGSNVQLSDLQCLVQAQGLAIAPSEQTDTLTFSGIEYKLVGVRPIHSGDEVAAYSLHLRK